MRKGSAGHYYNRYVGPGQLRAQSVRHAWKVHEQAMTDGLLSADDSGGNGGGNGSGNGGGNGGGNDGGGNGGGGGGGNGGECAPERHPAARESRAEPPSLALSNENIAAQVQAAGLTLTLTATQTSTQP